MVRLRDTAGKTQVLNKDTAFVELCNKEGEIVALLYVTEAGDVRICEPGSKELSRYSKLFGVKTAEESNLLGLS